MNIISIDSSKANVGIYIRTDKEIYFTIQTKEKKTDAEKYLHIRDEVKKACTEHEIEVAFIEDYPYSMMNSRSVTALAEVKGLILIVLYELGISVIKISPSTWQAMVRVILPKKVNKKLYIDSVNSFYKKEFKTTDEADAYMMLLTACYIFKGVIKTDKHLLLQKRMKAIGELF